MNTFSYKFSKKLKCNIQVSKMEVEMGRLDESAGLFEVQIPEFKQIKQLLIIRTSYVICYWPMAAVHKNKNH